MKTPLNTFLFGVSLLSALLLVLSNSMGALAVAQHAGGGSFKSQMKKADASGARYALILGDNEAAAGTVAVKPMRDAAGQPIQGEQAIITGSAVAAYLQRS